MATSASTNFELDVSDYIEEAYERCGLETRTGYDLKSAKRSLNLMLLEGANRGLNQWTIAQRTQTVTASDGEYSLGTDVIDILSLTVLRDSTYYSLERISRDSYLAIPNKSQTGRPTQYAIQRGRNNPTVMLYPTPDNSKIFSYPELAPIIALFIKLLFIPHNLFVF